MTIQEGNQGCVVEFKQCLNYQHCQGHEGCSKDNTGKIISGYQTKKELCFSCTHWEELYENRFDNEIIHIRVEGNHYQFRINDINKPSPKYAGFGGRKFIVKLDKSKRLWPIPDEFEICNMWSQGTIPQWFKDKLPDNAEFVNEVTKTVAYDGQEFITCWDIL